MPEIQNEKISNKELAEELHKPIIRNFHKRKVRSPFIDNIWETDLADMQLINKFNKGFKFLLWKTEKALQLLIIFKKKSYINQIANQIKHGLIKVVNFTIDQWNHG